jgi:hypothetical protein
MPFVVMVSAKRIVAVVAMATVARIRERNILVLVVANPVGAALGLGQLSRLTAQAAFLLDGIPLGLCVFCFHLYLFINVL